jgi:dienelactone hydrolase
MIRIFSKFLVFLGFCLCFQANAQQKKVLNHEVYDSWNRISGQSISTYGTMVIYTLEPQEGDPSLVLYNVKTGSYDSLGRANGAVISADERYAAYKIPPPYKETKKAKILKKKPDEMPKDSLGIIDLTTMNVTKIPRLKSFKFPEHSYGWIAYQTEKEPAVSKDKKNSPSKDETDAEDDEKDKKDDKGNLLTIRSLSSGQEYSYKYVAEYLFPKYGKNILFAATAGDSVSAAGVFVFNTETLTLDTIKADKGTYKQLSWNEMGTLCAFVADTDTSMKAKQRYYSLYYWNGAGKAEKLVDSLTPGMKRKWLVSEFAAPTFSKNKNRLFFGTAPVPMPEDTTLNDEETAKLDIWHWNDDQLQPQQLKQLEQEKKRSYLAVIDLREKKFLQLGDRDLPTVQIGDEGNADIALGINDIPYRRQASWEQVPRVDAYVVNVTNGARHTIAEKLKGRPELSPEAKYAFWYDLPTRNWYTVSTSTFQKKNVTKSVKVPLFDELDDVPDDPSEHGSMGWSKNDKDFFIYDRYDIWKIDPEAVRQPVNVTGKVGRQNKIVFRYVKLDKEERSLDASKTVLLQAFDERDKSAGFYHKNISDSRLPVLCIVDGLTFSKVMKADSANTIIYIQSNFIECPNLFITDFSFKKPKRISNANPQQHGYNWGTAELVRWKTKDKVELEGLLYKPENFDSQKKYPMIVYFYERNSNTLHSYSEPAPSASTINKPLYVSNGYLVFVPDIKYRTGYPGKSALNCIVSGTEKIVSMGFVDEQRIGIQGQSWGGYQVAYLVTHTNMFRAAMAGAPVSNMTSAYGGIRWESGMSREWQYEKSQSRIGGSLWDRFSLYVENSPIFKADQVKTPLLMMHNDADGAVPWYQGIEFFTALRRLGKPVWMLVYNNEAHNLVQRKNRKDLSKRMLQFFDHYLKNQPAPEWLNNGLPAINKGKTMGYETIQK